MSAAALPAGHDVAAAYPKPLFRGVLHLIVAVIAPAGLVMLLLLAGSPRAYVGASVYGTCIMLLYTSSANYHLAPWSRRWNGAMKRLDHAMIFLLIAGSYTPFCLIVLGDAWGIPMLSVVWSFAGLGVLVKLAWPYAPRWLSTGLYLALGWVGVVAAAPVARSLDIAPLVLLAAGGLLYTAGAIVYALRRPDPFPRIFGFHEVFHALVIAGSAVHFTLIAVWLME